LPKKLRLKKIDSQRKLKPKRSKLNKSKLLRWKGPNSKRKQLKLRKRASLTIIQSLNNQSLKKSFQNLNQAKQQHLPKKTPTTKTQIKLHDWRYQHQNLT
jgi:hypothetical protein